MDLTDKIIAYECGQLAPNEAIELFAELIKTGKAWRLQGHYGRMAKSLIDTGFIDRNGNILRWVDGAYLDE